MCDLPFHGDIIFSIANAIYSSSINNLDIPINISTGVGLAFQLRAHFFQLISNQCKTQQIIVEHKYSIEFEESNCANSKSKKMARER